MTGTGPIRVLHVRQSAGGGGGADTVLRQILTTRWPGDIAPTIAYLHKPSHDVGPLLALLRSAGVTAHDVPGGARLDRDQFRRLAALAAEADIIHSHDVKSDALARLLQRRMPELKIVSTLHGWTARTAKGRLYERLDKWLLRTFDRVIAVSGATRLRAQAGGKLDPVVIHNGIDTGRWKPSDRPIRKLDAPFTVGFIGRLSAEKNPAGVVEVASRCPGMRFLVAGEGPERTVVESRLREERLADRVSLLGQVGPDDLPAFFSGLDAVLLTSWTEGLPLTLLEAGAMALPVVATAVGGVPELVRDGETGWLAPAGDYDALAGNLRTLRDDPAGSSAMGHRARQRVETDFSLAGVIDRIARIYRELAPPGANRETAV